MSNTAPMASALLLLILANAAPWAAARLLGDRWAAPLDGGRLLRDGRRLFGSHKTWRGLVAGITVCALAAPLLDLPWLAGAGFGGAALLGDALSSAVKRRLALPPGTAVPGLDQLPEALLPLIALAAVLELDGARIILVALAFLALNLLAARLRHPGSR